MAPGEVRRLELPVARLVTQTTVTLPLTVMHGKSDGPRLWISAALHGDELNGTEIIRRVLRRVKVERLKGTLIAAPVVNVFGFLAQSRYLPDRRDLNRSFPGAKSGSLAGRLANLFLTEVVDRCTHGIDFHTGSNNRINLPQIRANLEDAEIRRCAEAFSAPLMIQAKPRKGSLRYTADKRGIANILFEGGEPLRFNRRSIAVGVNGAVRVMQEIGMLKAPRKPRPCGSLETNRTKWIRASRSGIVHPQVGLKDFVKKNEVVAQMHDVFGDVVAELRSPLTGLVLGLTTNPLVNRGEAVMHVAALRSS